MKPSAAAADAMTHSTLTRHFLIAMPAMTDPNFARSVTLLCEHSDLGAMGLVINRPVDLQLKDVLAQVGVDPDQAEGRDAPVFFGGPVQPNRGFVIHEPAGAWDSTLRLGEDLGITTSRDVLQAIAEQRGPDRFLVTLGYAGWSAGQLEREITENAWLHCPADRAILFDTPPERRWQAAAALVGVDLSTLSGEAGHA